MPDCTLPTEFTSLTTDQSEHFYQWGKQTDDDRAWVEFTYYMPDSREGAVSIRYVSIVEDIDAPDEGFDVEISTGSDVWSLADSHKAIGLALDLHSALGHAQGYQRADSL